MVKEKKVRRGCLPSGWPWDTLAVKLSPHGSKLGVGRNKQDNVALGGASARLPSALVGRWKPADL